MNGRWTAVLLVLSTVAQADYELDLRHELNRSMPNLVQQSAVWRGDLSWSTVRVGARLSESWIGVDRVSYFGEWKAEPVSFFHALVRLQQTARLGQSGSTSAIAVGGLCVPTHSVTFCAEFGVLRRLWQLAGTAWLPLVYSTSVSEWDAVAQLYWRFRWSERWWTAVQLASYESVEIYNIHNPFLQVTVGRIELLENVDVMGFGRYQVVLGFGTLGTWTTGIGLELRDSVL